MAFPPAPGDSNFSLAAETTSNKHLYPPGVDENVPSSVYVMAAGINASGDFYDLEMFSDVLDDFRASLYTYSEPSTIVLLCFYVPIFLLALFGNVLVFLIIVGNKNMRSVTNYFLLNLAIADILVTIVCIPLTVGETVYRVWVYGEFMCKATGYLQGVCVSASVLTIMALSIDRYIAIRHPVKSRRLSTKKHVKIAIVLIWVISCGIMVPLTVVRSLSSQTIIGIAQFSYCHENWSGAQSRRLFDIFLFVFIYVIPGVIVTSSYSATGCHLLSSEHLLQRQDSDVYQSYKIMAGRRRVARMLLILAILFAVSWMPYYAVNLYMNFSSKRDAGNSLMTLSFSLMLGHSHSAQNPILYCLTNNSFKRGMIGLLKCQKTNLSDFTRASARSDPRYPRRCQSERRVKDKRWSPAMRRGSDGCLVTVNPMTSGHEYVAFEGRNNTLPSTLPSSTSSDGEESTREEIPLMEVNHRVTSQYSPQLRHVTYHRDDMTSQSLHQLRQDANSLVDCRVEVSPSNPCITRTLVYSEDNASTHNIQVPRENHLGRTRTISCSDDCIVHPRILDSSLTARGLVVSSVPSLTGSQTVTCLCNPKVGSLVKGTRCVYKMNGHVTDDLAVLPSNCGSKDSVGNLSRDGGYDHVTVKPPPKPCRMSNNFYIYLICMI